MYTFTVESTLDSARTLIQSIECATIECIEKAFVAHRKHAKLVTITNEECKEIVRLDSFKFVDIMNTIYALRVSELNKQIFDIECKATRASNYARYDSSEYKEISFLTSLRNKLINRIQCHARLA